MRRRTGLDHPGATAGSLLRILALSVVATASAWAIWRGLDEVLGAGVVAQVLAVGAGLAAGTAAYLGLSRLFGVREVNALRALRGGG